MSKNIQTAAAKLYHILYPKENYYRLNGDQQRFYQNAVKQIIGVDLFLK